MEKSIEEQITEIFLKSKNYFENREWHCWIDKYKDFNLAFEESWNFTVFEKKIPQGKANMEPFYRWLSERIELCLNLHRTESNEYLKTLHLERIKTGDKNG